MSQLRKHDQIEFDASDPWKGDVLGRRAVADYLTPLVASCNQPFVIGLHGSFGTGKSFLVRSWEAQLRADGYKTAVFNAWESDFAEEPLFAFMAALRRQIPELVEKDKREESRSSLGEVTKRAGRFLMRRGGPLLVRGLARRAFGEGGVEEVAEGLGLTEDNVADLAGKLAEDGLAAHEAAEQSLEQFRDALAKAIATITSEADDDGKRKLILFVDELDRCRPSYAIEILETVKHLFSVPGLVFVLATDEVFLQSAVAAVYGPTLDAEGYLQRFIDWRLRLPAPDCTRYVRHLTERFGLTSLPRLSQKNGADTHDIFAKALGLCASALKLSLRQIEQLVTEANVVFRATPTDQAPLPLTLGIALPLLARHGALLRSCAAGRKDRDRLLELLDPDFSGQNFDDIFVEWKRFRAVIAATFLNDNEFEELRGRFQAVDRQLQAYAQAPDRKVAPIKQLDEEYEHLRLTLEGYQHIQRGLYSTRNSLMNIVLSRIDHAAAFTRR